LGDTLYLTNPYVLAQKGKKKQKKTRSKLDLSYLRAHTWEEAVPLLLPQHYKPLQASKKEKK
jgi:hypothetical protein